MKNIIFGLLMLVSATSFSQDLNVVLKQASNLERKQKEDSAILKYKEAISIDGNNQLSLIKLAELTAAAGARQTDKKLKRDLYDQANEFANKAFALDSTNVDANYVRGLVAFRLSQVEQENKKQVAFLKDARRYAEKALAINPNHGKSNYLMGKWNFEIVNTAWTKKTAARVLYGGVAEAKMETAISYMEKCRTAEPYYVQNFLDLAKAYKFEFKPSNAIEVLNQLVKLPTRTADDAAMKAEGKQMLSEMQ